MNQPVFQEILPADAKAAVERGEARLIDVREADELLVAFIEGSEHYPLSEAASWIDTLPKDEPLIIFCHHGGRSAQVTLALGGRGYANVHNMRGGIDAWSQTVDADVPRY